MRLTLPLAVLHCPECSDDVPHRVTYKVDTVVETVCTQCNRALLTPRRQRALYDQLDLPSTDHPSRLPMLALSPRQLGSLAAELPLRAMTKPGRLLREVRRDGAGVLLSVPRRAATKPLRLVAELAGLARSDHRARLDGSAY